MNNTLSGSKPLSQEVQVLRNGMLFSLTRRTWSNRRSADKTGLQTTANKAKLNLTKQLIDSPELDKINDHLNEIYTWCLARAMPSTAIRRGIYFVKRTMVSEFESRLSASRLALRNELVPAFIATYNACRQAMKSSDKLGNLYLETDYPKLNDLPGLFGIEWSWLALSVPEELPEEVRQREVGKLRDSFLEAQEEIRYALRVGFKQLVDRAVERLTVKVGEKPKKFHDTLITNFNEFFETFQARNLMEDSELSNVIDAARKVVAGLPHDVDVLRNSDGVRSSAAASFAQINSTLDSLVVDKPSRQFDFEA